jgi:hypothetical protein
MEKMTSLDRRIVELKNKSDIPVGSPVYEEIKLALAGFELNLAFFVFNNRLHAVGARPPALDSPTRGRSIPVPAISLYLKYDEDYRKMGLDAIHDNWLDEWSHTAEVRNVVNSILKRNHYNDDYISDQTFIFFLSLENIVFDAIGRAIKPAVYKLICSEIRPLQPASLYWHSDRIYFVVMHNFIEVKLIKETAKSQIKEGVKKLISNADPDGYCQNHDVIIKYYHLWSKDINLMGLARED